MPATETGDNQSTTIVLTLAALGDSTQIVVFLAKLANTCKAGRPQWPGIDA
jgi:hypothetical protein